MSQYPAVINVLTLNSSQGFTVTAPDGDFFGAEVVPVGDVNKDGHVDLVLAVPHSDVNAGDSGADYLIYGSAAGFGGNQTAAQLAAKSAFTFEGNQTSSLETVLQAPLGDFNGDGKSDLLFFNKGQGQASLVYGTTLQAGDVRTPGNTAAGSQNAGLFNIVTTGTDTLRSVAFAGDINGDGYGDIIVGADGDISNTATPVAYVIYGGATTQTETVDLSNPASYNGFTISGVSIGSPYTTGDVTQVTGLGDVNGDGIADFLIGVPSARNGVGSGVSYVVFGSSAGFGSNLDLSTLNGSNGFELIGLQQAYGGIVSGQSPDDAGATISMAGDINGDGYADLIIGAPRTSPTDTARSGNSAGAAYVVFGGPSGFPATIDLTQLNGTNGFRLVGDASLTEGVGLEVRDVGDVNGDGYDDIMVSAPNANAGAADDPGGPTSGAVFILFGKAGGFSPTIDLYNLNGSDGFKLYAPVALTHLTGGGTLGDINGDGINDLVVYGNQNPSSGTDNALVSYVIYGNQPDTAVTRTGTAASQTLAGGAFNDTLSGLAGDDKLYGNGGNDILTVGTGNDYLNGGAGNDTAVFSANYAAYTVTKNGDGTTTVAGPDGTDTLVSIENLQFADQTITLTHAPARGDFNADGNSDLLWQADNGTVGVWLMNASTVTANPTVGDPGPSWQALGTGDFDGDGRADILLRTGATLGIWEMNGGTITANPTIAANLPVDWKVAAIADVDGDGKSDLVLQNSNGQAGIWFLSGSNLTSNPTIGSNPGPSWHVVAAGDMNGDGDADLVWQNDSGQVGIWLMDGATVLANPTIGTADPNWHVVGTGDFNGDGKADLLFQNTNGQVAIWLMDGTTILSQVNVGTNPGPAWQAKGTADLNGDGDADIIFQNSGGQAGAWLMSGTTILSQPYLGTNPGTSWHLISPSGG